MFGSILMRMMVHLEKADFKSGLTTDNSGQPYFTLRVFFLRDINKNYHRGKQHKLRVNTKAPQDGKQVITREEKRESRNPEKLKQNNKPIV